MIYTINTKLYVFTHFFCPQTCFRWCMGVCTVECNSGSCCHVFWWGFAFSDIHLSTSVWSEMSIFKIKVLFHLKLWHIFQLLSATITASWSTGRCRSPRWAAGLLSRMYLWAQPCCSVLSLLLQVMQLLLVIHKVNYCTSWVRISAPITLINLWHTVHNALKEPEHDYIFSCCVSCLRWYIWELLQEWQLGYIRSILLWCQYNHHIPSGVLCNPWGKIIEAFICGWFFN